MKAEELKKEVETRMNKGETFSFDEIRKIMKNTGLSYKQVVSRAMKLKKDMDKAEMEAEEKGVPFNRESFIKERMN